MLIQSGRVAALEGLPWVAIELGSELQTDEIALGLTRWAVSNLERYGKAFQLLYPVESRPLAGARLLSPHLWMRVADLSDLRSLASAGIRGMRSGAVVGLMCDAGGQPIPIPPEFVDDLIARVRSASDAWSAGIEPGSGVRILLGSARMLCGVVESVIAGEAEVRISLKSRAIRLRVPVRALQNLGSGPRDYFHKDDED